MSLSVSGFPVTQQIYGNDPAADPKPAPTKPPVSQQVQELAAAGQSSQQIASTLGLPLAEVQQSLGDTTTTATTQASALVALSGRLSVKA